MASETAYRDLIPCLHCDNLCKYQSLSPGQKAICPTCGGVLLYRKINSVERTLAIATGGLFLYLPAISLPLIGISVAGQFNDTSLVGCIAILIEHQFPVSAFLLFLLTLAIPLLKLCATFYLTLCLKLDRVTPRLIMFFRTYRNLSHWAMQHIFFLGLVISLYKIISLADVSVDLGLLSFTLLLICSTLVSTTIDEHFIWQKMEDSCVR